MSEYKNGGNNNMLWEQGVAGSNPATPTQKTKELQKCDSFFLFFPTYLKYRLSPKNQWSIS